MLKVGFKTKYMQKSQQNISKLNSIVYKKNTKPK